MSARRNRSQQGHLRGRRRCHTAVELLPIVREGLDELAAAEKTSTSRVVAEIVSEYFDLDARTGEPLRRYRRA